MCGTVGFSRMGDEDWRCGQGTLANKCEFFWSQHSSTMGDVTFLVGTRGQEEEVKGFKILLILTSPVFETLFSETWSNCEGSSEPIRLPHTDPSVFRHFLRVRKIWPHYNLLLLRDNVTTEDLESLNLSMRDMLELFFLTKEYLVTSLRSICQDLIRKNTRVETVLEIYENIHGKDEGQLEMDTFKFISINALQIFQQEYFLEISKDLILSILASDELRVDEINVFKAAKRWTESQSSKDTEFDEDWKRGTSRQILRECLTEIRLPLVTPRDFSLHIRPTGVLDPDEALALYDYFVRTDEEKKSLYGPLLTLSEELSVRTEPRSNVVRSVILSQTVDDLPFECTGEEHYIWFRSSETISIIGLGFSGPVHTNANYDLKLWIQNKLKNQASAFVQNMVFAKLGHTFHLPLLTPVPIEKDNWYNINFSLKGPPTGSTESDGSSIQRVSQHGVNFEFQHSHRQLVEIMYCREHL